MAGDLLDEAARLIADLGGSYTRARRYRALAADCEARYLAPALAIGSEMRERSRDPEPDREACAVAVAELRRLAIACEAAIAAVRASALYRAAVRAWDEEHWREVAALAPTIFDAIEPFATVRPLHFAVSVAGRRGGEHFLPPATVAERLLDLLRIGLPAADPVPELGADETLRAVVLDEDPEAIEAPITVIVAPEDVVWPLFRLEPAGEIFVYAPRVQARMRVRCASHVDDEWWAVRPEAYSRYIADLERELAARGVDDVERG
ncbi:MAG: hypothetical protein HY271_11605 [Deltaproteobacteria bacterium]|nr:hypothetical protein [Deltaproteobacteria bacterium]